jgi:hypothetical protein
VAKAADFDDDGHEARRQGRAPRTYCVHYCGNGTALI